MGRRNGTEKALFLLFLWKTQSRLAGRLPLLHERLKSQIKASGSRDQRMWSPDRARNRWLERSIRFFFFCFRGEIHLYDSLGFLGLYVIYILVVVVGRWVHQRGRQNQLQVEDPPSNDVSQINSEPNSTLVDNMEQEEAQSEVNEDQETPPTDVEEVLDGQSYRENFLWSLKVSYTFIDQKEIGHFVSRFSNCRTPVPWIWNHCQISQHRARFGPGPRAPWCSSSRSQSPWWMRISR